MTCGHFAANDFGSCALCKKEQEAVERKEAERDMELMRASVNELPTIKAAQTLIEAASRAVDLFSHDRIPMTRDQSLALMQLANAALHLTNLLP